jgi:crotonobetainyl-CoA:carnitine CoA-transferase CaiB-like acyl-CoA transferase
MLDDVVMLEVGDRLATAYAGRLLRDLGACVVWVEPPGGDPLRHSSPAYAEYLDTAAAWIARAGRVDLVVHDDSDRAMELVTNVRQAHPSAVVIAVSDYGQTGPDAQTPASELTLQAEVGMCIGHATGPRPPVDTGPPLGELAAGASSAQTAITGLLARDAGASSVSADLSVFEALAGLMPHGWLYGGIDGHSPYPTSLSPVPGIERARDGWVCIVSVTGPQWNDFKRMAQVPELDDPRFELLSDRVAHEAEVTALVRRFTQRHTVEELVDLGAADREVFVPQASGRGVRPRPPFRSADLAWTVEDLPAVGAGTDGITLPVLASATRPSGTAAQPLAGIRVLELGTFHAGPLVTAYLASLGADVVKVEAVGRPDLVRFAGIPSTVDRFWERSAAFTAVNLGKRGITADLTLPEGMDVVKRLVAASDVVLENFLPRVLDERGLDEHGIHALNPDVVLIRMPAWGLNGPWRDRPGFTYTVNAAGGMAELTGYPDGAPLLTGTVIDPFAAIVATTAALAALRRRTLTGRGTSIEVALCDVAAQPAAAAVVEWSANGNAMTRSGNRRAGTGPRNLYRTADGHWVAIDAEKPEHWAALSTLPLVKDWAGDPAYDDPTARAKQLTEIDDRLATVCLTVKADSLVATLRNAGVPAAVSGDGIDLPQHRQVLARGQAAVLDHAVIGPQSYLRGPAVFTSGPEPRLHSSSPLFGEHNHEVLHELGIDAATIEDWTTRGLIGGVPFGLAPTRTPSGDGETR